MLELVGVGHAYSPRSWVFRGLDVTVAAGTAAAVIGPNGRGKSTLVRCAAGLLTPTEGTVRRAAPAGYVPQGRSTTFAYPVRDMVLMGRARQVGTFAGPGPVDRAAAAAALDLVGLDHLAGRAFPTLSGGEQQLVLIARALAGQSPLLVLDEPTTGLDLHNQARVLGLLRALADDGMAVLLTTHDPDHALHVADTVVMLDGPAGTVSGPTRTMLTEARLSSLYGVDVHSVTYVRDGRDHHTLVTRYDGPGDAGPRAGRPAPGG